MHGALGLRSGQSSMASWARRLPGGQVAVELGGMVLAGRLGGDGDMADAVQPEGPWAVAQPTPAMQVGVLPADHQAQRLDQAALGDPPCLSW